MYSRVRIPLGSVWKDNTCIYEIVNTATDTPECSTRHWSKISAEDNSGNGSQHHKRQIIWTEADKTTGTEVTKPSGTHTMVFCLSDASYRAKGYNICQSWFPSYFCSIPTFCTTTLLFWNENVYSELGNM